jgi:hypothetical protein
MSRSLRSAGCSDGEITEILGSLVRNAGCQSSVLKRLLAVPVHEHIHEVAFEQMEAGARRRASNADF